jgi:tetratricopeptide (TPR) repeat protein
VDVRKKRSDIVRGPGICYFSTPFGARQLSDGRRINHEQIFHVGVRPVLEKLGLQAVRGDEVTSGAIIMKSVFAVLLGSDVAIADISGGSPNVMYELGIRHALRRNVTVLIMARGDRIPYNLSYSRVIMYELDDSGGMNLESRPRFQEELLSAVQEGLARITNDSPLYEFYPGLAVELPEELVNAEARRRVQPRLVRKRAVTAESLEKPEQKTEEADPLQLINEMRRLRDKSAWRELVSFVDSVPPEVANAPEAIQLVALALNRLGEQDEAIRRIEKLIAETGGDAESFGILGRIHKDRYTKSERAEDLEAAIRSYQAGFEKQPSEFYPGINAVSLRVIRNNAEDQAELPSLLPRVREAVKSRLTDSQTDYWTLASALELACVARDWAEAEEFASRARAQGPSAWMIESTAIQLRMLGQTMEEPDRGRLEHVREILQEVDRA